MISKVYKYSEDSEITIYGSNRDIQLFYKIPPWKKDDEEIEDEMEELAFRFRGSIYYLSEFTRMTKNCLDWEKEFDGCHGESYFSGVYVKVNDDLTVKAFYMTQ